MLNLRDLQVYRDLNKDINNLLDEYINNKGVNIYTKKDLEGIKLMINCASNSKINRDSRKNQDALIDEHDLKYMDDEIIAEYHRLLETIDIMQIEFDCKKDILTDEFIAEFRHDFFYISMIANRLDVLYYLRENYLKTTNFHKIKDKI